jgi:hypothetical protein
LAGRVSVGTGRRRRRPVLSVLALGIVAMAAAACGSHPSARLADGTASPALPRALRSIGDGVFVTKVRASTLAAADREGLATCRRRARVALPAHASIAERVTRTGISFTVAWPEGLFACDMRPGKHPGRTGRPCGMASGRFEHGRLLDPRLTLSCGFGRKDKLAFAWIQPRAGTRWLVVHDGPHRDLYSVTRDMPVRISLTHGISERDASATTDVDDISAAAARTARERLVFRVAG